MTASKLNARPSFLSAIAAFSASSRAAVKALFAFALLPRIRAARASYQLLGYFTPLNTRVDSVARAEIVDTEAGSLSQSARIRLCKISNCAIGVLLRSHGTDSST